MYHPWARIQCKSLVERCSDNHKLCVPRMLVSLTNVCFKGLWSSWNQNCCIFQGCRSAVKPKLLYVPGILVCCGTKTALKPKGPFRTKNATTIAKIVNYYAVVFLLRPPDSLLRRPFSEKENVCNSQENGVRTRCATIVSHRAIVKI